MRLAQTPVGRPPELKTLIGAVQLQETGITRCVGALAFLLRVEVSKKLVDCKKFMVYSTVFITKIETILIFVTISH